MAHRILAPYRRAFYALVCSLEFILTACSGGAGDVTAPDPGPLPQDPPGGAQASDALVSPRRSPGCGVGAGFVLHEPACEFRSRGAAAVIVPLVPSEPKCAPPHVRRAPRVRA